MIDFKGLFNQGVTWQSKVITIEVFHLSQKLKNHKWTVKDTSEYFEVSVSLISEDLKLAQALDRPNFKHVAECKSRNQALILLRELTHE